MNGGPAETDYFVVPYILVMALATAWIVAPWYGHVDDRDAQVYQVVARHMVEDHDWLNLRYLSGAHPKFREQLPFGIWPFAAAISVSNEQALAPTAALFSLATIALVGWIATVLGGHAAGLVAMVMLATNKVMVYFGGRSRLDPLLILLATAAAAHVLVPRVGRKQWIASGVFGALAALVKGPFGLLPLASAIAARSIVERSPRLAVRGGFVVVSSTIPVAAFLLTDKWFMDGTWWNGYFLNQLFASAVGVRLDGHVSSFYPLSVVSTLFLPGIPLAILGLWQILWNNRPIPGTNHSIAAVNDGTLRMVALLCMFVLLGLCFPARKLSHHAWIVFPWLGVLCGLVSGRYVEVLLSSEWRRKVLKHVLLAAVALSWSFSLGGLGAKLNARPCVISQEFAEYFDHVPPATDILVVSKEPRWGMLASIAAERKVVAWPIQNLISANPSFEYPARPRLALVRTDELPQGLGRWRKVDTARGWTLLKYDDVAE